MRKLMVLLLVLIVVSAGCIGGKTSQLQTSESGTESTATGSATQTKTASQKENAVINPLEVIKTIKQYNYVENSSAELIIETETGGMAQQINVSLLILENGYVDLEGRKAKIQTRTTTLPDNLTINTTWVIIGETAYYVGDLGGMSVENDTSFWSVNPVSLAESLLKLKPVGNYTENGTLVLVYSVPEELILPMAEFYFTTPDMNTTVTDATAELYFTDEEFTGMKLTYGIIATTTAEDISGEIIEVTERGYWKGTIKITSINKKEEVEAPST